MSGDVSPRRMPVALMIAIVLGLSVAAPVAFGQQEATGTTHADRAALVARGAYLVNIAACNDCHTPMAGPTGPDMSRMLSGHPADMPLGPAPAVGSGWLYTGAATNTAFAGPWGTSYAINLTPDQETGIGTWTEQMFVGALRTGRHMGEGRPIAPPMPWQAYRHMTDDDLAAIFAYLQSIPPIANAVPDYQPPAPGTAPAE